MAGPYDSLLGGTQAYPGYQGYAGYGTVEYLRKLALERELAAGAEKPPKNVGEGIFSAAGAFADVIKQRRLEAAAKAQAEREGKYVSGAPAASATAAIPATGRWRRCHR
jgi:hypothetical protein